MQCTLQATRRTPHSASRLGREIDSAWLVGNPLYSVPAYKGCVCEGSWAPRHDYVHVQTETPMAECPTTYYVLTFFDDSILNIIRYSSSLPSAESYVARPNGVVHRLNTQFHSTLGRALDCNYILRSMK